MNKRMDSSVFNRLLDELDGNSLKTLKEKNARYSRNADSLHNFRAGAEITGKTPAETCWGYASKHLIALRDMVDANDFSNREDFLEKCQDAINYIRFLWCIGNDKEYWEERKRPKACEGTISKEEKVQAVIEELLTPYEEAVMGVGKAISELSAKANAEHFWQNRG